MRDKEDLLASLATFEQQHLLDFWDELDAEYREILAEDVAQIDFRQVAKLFERKDVKEDFCALAQRMGPPPSFRSRD